MLEVSVKLAEAEVKNGKVEAVVEMIMRGDCVLPLKELLRVVEAKLLEVVRSPTHEI